MCQLVRPAARLSRTTHNENQIAFSLHPGLEIRVHFIAPIIYIPTIQHLSFLASMVLFWPGSDFSAENVDPGQNTATEARNAKCFLIGM